MIEIIKGINRENEINGFSILEKAYYLIIIEYI